jgi:hypothetical protein
VLGGESERTLALLEGPQPGSLDLEQLHRVVQDVLEDLSEVWLSTHLRRDAPNRRVPDGDTAARLIASGDRHRMRGGRAG